MKSRTGDDPLQGLDPEALLREGAADDDGFDPPGLEELARLFPQFEILEFIGRGGMGAVYRVRQKQLDRVVALKILPPGIGVQADFPGRFAREARAMARLNHPGIVTVHEFGGVEDLHFIVMEYVDGVNLRALLKGGRMAPREALAIVPQVCDALQYAHDHGIVHRDIKPENILIDRQGRVKVADFGLAKLAGPQAEGGAPGEGVSGPFLTEPGLMGTPAYMAPEQRDRPSEADHRADIYVLGVVLYQMLTGELPDVPLDPPSRKVVLDVRLDEVVLKALESEPERRYAAASQFKTGLEEATAGAAPSAVAWRGWRRMEYRSRASVFGWPLVHVAMGADPATGRAATARGILAIGDRAVGVVAMGGMSCGVLAFGGLSAGVFAFGGLALGLFSYGGLAVALLAAFGGLAIGPVALGGLAVGFYAMGGMAYGVHGLSGMVRDAAAVEFFRPWAGWVISHFHWINAAILSAGLVPWFGGMAWLLWRQRTPGGGPGFPGRKAMMLAGVMLGILMSALLMLGIGIATAPRVDWSGLFGTTETFETNVPLTPEDRVIAASAQEWLGLVDHGEYARSWKVAAPFFQESVSNQLWDILLNQVRAPLGAVKSRRLQGLSRETTLPAAPPGHYAVLQFETDFASKAGAHELLTLSEQEDGSWRAAGYFIQ